MSRFCREIAIALRQYRNFAGQNERIYRKRNQIRVVDDRKNRQVEICRQAQDVEVLDHPSNVSGEDVLPGFILDLTEVW